MSRLRTSRKIIRVAVVTAAMVMTLAKSALVSPRPEARQPPRSEYVLHSKPVVSNSVADDPKMQQQHASPAEGYTQEENVHDGVASPHSSRLRPFHGVQLACMSFLSKPPCKNLANDSFKRKEIGKRHVYELFGKALVDTLMHHSPKDVDQHKQGDSLILRPNVRNRHHLLRSEIRYDKQNDFESGNMLSHKRTSTILNHHIGKRHARSRSFGYQSDDEESRRHAINIRRMTHPNFNTGKLKSTLFPVEQENEENDYVVVKVKPAAQDEGRLRTGNVRPAFASTGGPPSYDLFNSGEFRKFQNHIENVVNMPIRQGYTRFASSKPTEVPAFGIQSFPGHSSRSKVPGEEVARDVCPSASDWVGLSYAQDNYGSTLKVLDTIEYNGTIVRQYFYETFCALNQTAAKNLNQLEPESPEKYDIHTGEGHECLAVDKKKWHSRCRERLIWTYGLVIRANGDVGWGVIAIRGSCSCSVWPQGPPEWRRPLMRLFIDDV